MWGEIGSHREKCGEKGALERRESERNPWGRSRKIGDLGRGLGREGFPSKRCRKR